jgi:hypothetical protein
MVELQRIWTKEQVEDEKRNRPIGDHSGPFKSLESAAPQGESEARPEQAP